MSTPVENGSARTGSQLRKLGLVALGLVAAVSLMLLAFVTPSIHSGAHDLPLAVSGPAQATDRLTAQLQKAQPGAFDVTRYASADDAATAIEERKEIGGIAVGTKGVTIQTASGAGSPYAQLLKSIGAAQQAAGRKVTYTELAPLTKDDPAGAGLTGLALPLTFGGMISAVLLSTLFKRSPGLRVAGSVGFAIVGGLLGAAIMQYGFHAIDGKYWLTALAIVLGIAAISLTVGGLEMLLGGAGLGIGAVLMMFVANPLSAMATGAAWLPHPWGTIGQGFPLGAAGTMLRSAAFFDGHRIGAALIVLSCWILLGLVLNLVAGRRRMRATAQQPQSTDVAADEVSRPAAAQGSSGPRPVDRPVAEPVAARVEPSTRPVDAAAAGAQPWVDPSMVATDIR